jgi:hypothetical protein
MKKPARAENPGLRVMILATSITFLVMGAGCGASHTGEIIGIDPVVKNETAATTTATASPT